MKRSLIGAGLALVLAGAGAVLVQPDPGKAALPLPCHRAKTARADTTALICRGIVRRLEQRRPDGTVVVVWPVTTGTP